MNENAAAADWGYGLATIFFQDEIQLDNTEFIIGLRYDTYMVNGKPAENAVLKLLMVIQTQ